MPSPLTFNRRFTAHRRVSESNANAGIDSTILVLARDVPCSLQAANPMSTRMEMGAPQVPCSHHIFTKTDISDLKKEDFMKDQETNKEYVVSFVDDAAGMGRLWCIYAWEKGNQ